MQTNRREFMKISAGGAAALSAMSAGAWVSGCTSSETASGMRFLRPGDVEMLTAMSPAILAGQLAPGDRDKIASVVRSFDELLGSTSKVVVDLVLQAFDVLTFMPTRGLMTGQWSSWKNATVDDAQKALDRLRDSRLGLLNAIYVAVVRMVVSSYYLVPANQGSTGYPGPPKKVHGPVPEVDLADTTQERR